MDNEEDLVEEDEVSVEVFLVVTTFKVPKHLIKILTFKTPQTSRDKIIFNRERMTSTPNSNNERIQVSFHAKYVVKLIIMPSLVGPYMTTHIYQSEKYPKLW